MLNGRFRLLWMLLLQTPEELSVSRLVWYCAECRFTFVVLQSSWPFLQPYLLILSQPLPSLSPPAPSSPSQTLLSLILMTVDPCRLAPSLTGLLPFEKSSTGRIRLAWEPALTRACPWLSAAAALSPAAKPTASCSMPGNSRFQGPAGPPLRLSPRYCY